MRRTDLVSMQFNELWRLHEEITKELAERIVAEKRELEKRLAQLNRSDLAGKVDASELSPALAGSTSDLHP